MLIFTNRVLDPGRTDLSAFGRAFTPGGTAIGVAAVARGGSGWSLSRLDGDVQESDALDLLLPLFRGPRPLLVYLHGGSSTPAHCFARCGALEAEYNVEVVGFSWAAEGALCDGNPLPMLAAPDAPVEEGDVAALKGTSRATAGNGGHDVARRYRQAKTNAQESVDALARFLRHVATARLISNAQPFTIAAHGLGAHLLQYTVDVHGAGESIGTAQNVVLLGPCVRADGHTGWLHQLRPRGRTYVTFHQGDQVLAGALAADGRKQEKLGASPGTTLLRGPGFRYISFSNAQTGPGGHRYFIEGLTTESRRLFGRLFRSELDLEPGEPERKIYPVGCEADGSVCYMALPDSAKFQ